MFKKFLNKNTINSNSSSGVDVYNVILEAAKISNVIYDWQDDGEVEKISIGQNCNSSYYLKHTNNKRHSYPFDWIFSSAEIVLHAIKDNFNTFLDKKMMNSITDDVGGHLFYHSKMFNHRNPLSSDENYDYYKRCADRFVTVIKTGKPIIFVCTVVNEPDKRPSWSNGFDREIPKPENQSIKSFMNLITVIQRINPRSKFLFVNQLTEGKLKIEYQFFAKDVLWIDFVSKGENTGVKYLDLLDDTIIKIIYNGLNEKKIELND
ncbi:MAG: DUF1796 family putative cysteine peptidase [Aequorivita antarctica]